MLDRDCFSRRAIRTGFPLPSTALIPPPLAHECRAVWWLRGVSLMASGSSRCLLSDAASKSYWMHRVHHPGWARAIFRVHLHLQLVTWETVWGEVYFISLNWARVFSCIGLGSLGHFVSIGSCSFLPPCSSHPKAQDAGHCRFLEFFPRSISAPTLHSELISYAAFVPFPKMLGALERHGLGGIFLYIPSLLSLAGSGFVIGELDTWPQLFHLNEGESNSVDCIGSTFFKLLPFDRHPPTHFKYIILILLS